MLVSCMSFNLMNKSYYDDNKHTVFTIIQQSMNTTSCVHVKTWQIHRMNGLKSVAEVCNVAHRAKFLRQSVNVNQLQTDHNTETWLQYTVHGRTVYDSSTHLCVLLSCTVQGCTVYDSSTHLCVLLSCTVQGCVLYLCIWLYSPLCITVMHSTGMYCVWQ